VHSELTSVRTTNCPMTSVSMIGAKSEVTYVWVVKLNGLTRKACGWSKMIEAVGLCIKGVCTSTSLETLVTKYQSRRGCNRSRDAQSIY
jgi:hypothetical protein